MCFGEPSTQQESTDLFLNSYRAISIWGITDAAANRPTIELLYGESSLPALVPGKKTFASKPTHFTPLYGSSGFGNGYNNYTWTAAVINDRLLFGTMDWRHLIDTGAGGTIPGVPLLPSILPGSVNTYLSGYGPDLWRFDSPDTEATPEDVRGAGNYLNYGIRPMLVSADGKHLYIGTANPMNLEPMGGRELRSLTMSRLSGLFQ